MRGREAVIRALRIAFNNINIASKLAIRIGILTKGGRAGSKNSSIRQVCN
jgi:hypothetical protein